MLYKGDNIAVMRGELCALQVYVLVCFGHYLILSMIRISRQSVAELVLYQENTKVKL